MSAFHRNAVEFFSWIIQNRKSSKSLIKIYYNLGSYCATLLEVLLCFANAVFETNGTEQKLAYICIRSDK